MLAESDYTCCECREPLTSGTMDLQVHHVGYIPDLEPWDHPAELMVVVCGRHHKERQAIVLVDDREDAQLASIVGAVTDGSPNSRRG